MHLQVYKIELDRKHYEIPLEKVICLQVYKIELDKKHDEIPLKSNTFASI